MNPENISHCYQKWYDFHRGIKSVPGEEWTSAAASVYWREVTSEILSEIKANLTNK